MGVFFSSLSALFASLYLALGIAAVTQNYKDKRYRLFFYMSLAAGFWNATGIFVFSAPDNETVNLWINISKPFWLFSFPLMLHFFLALTERKHLLGRFSFYFFLYGPSLIFLIQSYRSGLYFKGFYPLNGTWYPVIDSLNPWTMAYLVYILFFLLAPLWLLTDYLRESLSVHKKSQTRRVIRCYGLGLGLLLFSDFFLPAAGLRVPPLGQGIMIIWMIGMARIYGRRKGYIPAPAITGDDIIKRLNDCVVILRPNHLIEEVNPAFVKLLGRNANEILGLKLDPFLADPVPYHRAMERETSHPGGTPFESDLLTSTQATVPIEASVMKIMEDDQGVQGFSVVIRNMSDSHYLRRLEQEIALRRDSEEKLLSAKRIAESANLSKNRFLSTMSHEMKTPLNAVIGMMSLMAEADSLEEAQSFAATGLRSAQNLLNMINNVLEFAQFEEGKAQPENKPLHLHEILKSHINTFRYRADEQQILFETHLPEEAIPFFTDPHYIQQIVRNLLCNAFTFTHTGTVTLEITWENIDKEEPFLSITVTDTGIGIPPKEQRLIFDYFYQIDSDINRKYPGIGLGLALVKEMTRQLNGVVTLSSSEGKGSRFSVTIPSQEVPISNH